MTAAQNKKADVKGLTAHLISPRINVPMSKLYEVISKFDDAKDVQRFTDLGAAHQWLGVEGFPLGSLNDTKPR